MDLHGYTNWTDGLFLCSAPLCLLEVPGLLEDGRCHDWWRMMSVFSTLELLSQSVTVLGGIACCGEQAYFYKFKNVQVFVCVTCVGIVGYRFAMVLP